MKTTQPQSCARLLLKNSTRFVFIQLRGLDGVLLRRLEIEGISISLKWALSDWILDLTLGQISVSSEHWLRVTPVRQVYLSLPVVKGPGETPAICSGLLCSGSFQQLILCWISCYHLLF